ncbi:hypothetical protein SAMN05421767_10739 [Granulicatella balaenopterae]|uniref:Alpha-N-acetylgalactosaminidase n=1 Tax=Granulicatella balaenopterae TaxID=137733 RepID=A0A1H9IZJ6_9LACT|nr:alpha-N-acetylgalactosaminidase [Granulicatella balaenopterae]SEQ80221.1 hypothetical protein SAMN05421767_10739 [Granulicatella balaenopterae]
MEISNKKISRTFYYDGNEFYTSAINNLKANMAVPIKRCEEFIIKFLDGTEIYASECKLTLVKDTNEKVEVLFESDDIKINVVYDARFDVIAKTVTIQKSAKKINYIIVELIEFQENNQIYYPKKQKDIKEMAGFKGYYVELGQPVYANSLFLGTEFPLSENRVTKQTYTSKYYLGEQTEFPKEIFPAIVGSATDSDKDSLKQAFLSYLKGISQPSYFRKQYNSWYDHMTEINNDGILKSFSTIHKGFANYGVKLDAYVVDDGWTNYQSVWQFNEKFPNELTDIAELVKSFDASLGLWIGPRGGYNGTEVIMSDWLEAHPELKIGSKNSRSNDVNVGDFNYLREMKRKMLEYQTKYDISYWKIDGLLLQPAEDDASGPYGMHTMTKVYEFLVELFIDLRKERGAKDFWLNLTSYVNPSPWFLQWVNSLWIQSSQDVGYVMEQTTDTSKMITYRDSQYYEFLFERDIQLPLSSLYNHDPIYAVSAHTWYLDAPIHSTVAEFKDYLLFISTRGNGFWEFYYSYTMFDEERWQANSEAIKWIEQNYQTLKNSVFFGEKPSNMASIYGFKCLNDDESELIISYRNPSLEAQSIAFEYNVEDIVEIVVGQEAYIKKDKIELPAEKMLIVKIDLSK